MKLVLSLEKKNAGGDGLAVTLAEEVASKENRWYLALRDGDGGGDGALVVW
jgi:hypothetical protein